jgi:hypothetical protein
MKAKHTVEQLALKMKENKDLAVLELKIVMLDAGYRIQLSKEMKIAAVMNMAWKQNLDFKVRQA